LVDFWLSLNIPYVMTTTGISLADWSVGSRLQTYLLTLDSRLGEPKIDNGPVGATGLRDRHAAGSGTRSLGDERRFSKQPKGHEHELTNPRTASRKHHFWTDELSAVVALGNTTGGACCWTPDAALAKRACLGDIRWPEPLAMGAFPYCVQMRESDLRPVNTGAA
jgi:hypothetical protein